MNLRFFLQALIKTIFIFGVSMPIAYSNDDPHYRSCAETFDCGLLKGIGYPFWGSGRSIICGMQVFELGCEEDKYPAIYDHGVEKLRLLNISRSIPEMITISPIGVWGNDACPTSTTQKVTNNLLGPGLCKDAPNVIPLTLYYQCPSFSGIPGRNRFYCTINGSFGDAYFVDEPLKLAHLNSLKKCNLNMSISINQNTKEELWNGDMSLVAALNDGFDVEFDSVFTISCSACKKSGGICGSNETTFQFSCLCPDHPYPETCLGHGKKFTFASKNLVIGVGAIGVVLLASLIALALMMKNTQIIRRCGVFLTATKNHCNIEDLIKNYGALAPKRYKFSDVKKITNSYKEKLGQGGYGDVYKGHLPDGQIVAVKVLNVSKGNGEEFINEVASISKTSHVNIVTLLGFCLEGNKRALIYEFMPNGSLEKFIFKKNTTLEEENKEKLGWEKLYHIALGIAKGLEYLHCGCNTRILHLDIKPQNILLDEEFCPKISDFGLSKLCTSKDGIVSMLEARGTLGYIAPEVFSRNFGVVSHKSDIYSYGMVVLEMVGGKKGNKTGLSENSQYFPDWIYGDLDVIDELGLQGLSSKTETDTKKKMILVGLWCIQTKPSDRPSINKVIEMLEGSVETLPIPPKIFLSSPPRLKLDSISHSTKEGLEV